MRILPSPSPPTDAFSLGICLGTLQHRLMAMESAVARVESELVKVEERLQRLLILAALWGLKVGRRPP